MITNDFIQTLSAKVSAKAAQISPLASSLQKEFESKINDLLQVSIGKLNLVSREEFDAQVKVLARAQKTIDELETRIKLFEQLLPEQESSHDQAPTKNDDQTCDN